MIYLYAYTNFKDGLDSLRRVKVIYDYLTSQGKECEILLNEYRAQLTAREWGLPLATTIETIKDIDAIAGSEDIVLIDSPESIEGRVLSYPEKFKKVIYLNNSCQSVNFGNAIVLDIFKPKNLIAPQIKSSKKNGKTIFIYGDSDYEKTILKNLEIFKDKNLDLYWGVYFFVKYEDEMKEIFNDIVDSGEYYEVLSEYESVITSSLQVAIDCVFNGIKIVFLELNELKICQKDLLEKLQIDLIKEIPINLNIKEANQKEKISILNIIKSYM